MDNNTAIVWIMCFLMGCVTLIAIVAIVARAEHEGQRERVKLAAALNQLRKAGDR